MANSIENLRVEDDGLVCGEVGRWAKTKYRLVSLYDQLFATGMKRKWDQRVYIDLYAGAGYSKIRETDMRLKGSPVLALEVADPFDKYIFCEEEVELLSAPEGPNKATLTRSECHVCTRQLRRGN